MTIYRWITLGLLAYTSLAFEQRAEACSIEGGLYDTIPHNGDVYPANAALIFMGFGITLNHVTVTVDGVPAAFAAPPPMIKDVASLAAIITPEPMAGQTVAVQGSFCELSAPPPEGKCASTSLTYKAGPRDNRALAGANITSFDIHDYSDSHPSISDCGIDSDFTYWLHVASPDQPSASALFSIVEGYRGKGLSDLALKQLQPWPSDGTVQVIALKDTLKGASLPEALCFRVTTADAAGHVAPWSELVCDPCHYHVSTTWEALWSEPAWSASDIYPGGSCDPGGSGGAGAGSSGGTAFGGCAFQRAGGVGSAPTQLSLLAFCVALAVSARRHRRS